MVTTTRTRVPGWRRLVQSLVPAAILAGYLLPGLIAAPPAQAISPFPVTDSGSGTSGATNPKWTKSSTSSASGNTYTSDGWTRLTTASSGQSLTMVNNSSFPSSSGFQAIFDYRMGGGSGADGMTFFLQDGSATGIQSGASGGGLSYSGGGNGDSLCGVNSAFLGVGLDAYGNFSVSRAGNYGGLAASATPNRLVLRGSGAGNSSGNCGTGTNNNSWYNFLGAAEPSGTLATASSGDPATDSASAYRRVRITVVPSGTNALKVTVELTGAALKSNSSPGGYATLIDTTVTGGSNGQVALPSTLKLGFSASTGGSTNYHDIRNISVVGLADLGLTKTAVTTGATGPSSTYRAGDTVRYTLVATNNGPTAVGPSPNGYAKVYDSMAALPVKDVTWTCTASGGATCLTAGGGGVGSTAVNQTWLGPSGSSVTVNVTATATASTTASFTNTAVIPTYQSAGNTANTVDTGSAVVQNDAGLADTSLTNNTATAPLALAAPTVSLATTLGSGVSRINATDQFKLDIRTGSSSGTSVATATTTGSGSTVATGATSAYTASAGGTVYLTEAMASGSTSTIDQYTGRLTCTDSRGVATGLPTNAAFSGSYTLAGLQAGTELSCVVTNVLTDPTISVTKALGSIRLNAADQFQVQIRTGSVNGPVVSSTTNATTTGSGATVTAGTGTTGSYTATSGTTYYLTETKAAGTSLLTLYDRSITCTDSTAHQTGLPTGAALGAGLALTPVPGAVISCTLTNKADVTAPDAPVIAAPAAGARTNTNTPPISGTAEAFSTVTVYLDGASVGTATVNASGVWSFTPPSALADGSHTVRATATDSTGNVSSPSATTTFTVDTAAPAAPVVTSPANTSRTNDNTPTYAGTAEANASVAVIVDGVSAATVSADASGNWSWTPAAALADGSHTVRATATDAAGNVSASSATNTFTVDTAAPAAPVVTTPANGSRTNDDTPAVSGTAEAGSTVTVYVDGAAVGTTTADGSGAWSYTSASLVDGSHAVRATATDAAGNGSASSATNTFTVDTAAPAAPVVTTPANGSRINDDTPAVSGTAEANSTVTVYLDGAVVGTTTADGSGAWSYTSASLVDASHTVRATATDAAGNVSVSSNTNTFTVDTAAPAAPVVSTPANGSQIDDDTPSISGTAEAGSTVTVYVDGVAVGTTTADGSGAWSYVSASLGDASHTVRATATDPAGNVSVSSNTNTFTVDTAAPAAPVLSTPVDGAHTSDNTPTYAGTAEANSTVQLIVDGTQVATVTANGAGAWSWTPSGSLSDGPHTVRATATDAAGNTGPSSPSTTFTVDTDSPAAPQIQTPAGGDVTPDNTPTVSGLGEPGATVTISVDGAPVATAQVSAGGSWSWTPATALSDGPHTVAASQADQAGNTSPATPTTGFIVDTATPAAPAITAPEDGSATHDTTPSYSGTGEPGATVTVVVDGAAVGTTAVSGAGTWSWIPSSPLIDGPHTVTATQSDAAGNISPAAPSSTFTVDTDAPDAAQIQSPADGQATPDNTPTVSGLGEPGATVTISVDGAPVASAVVTPGGTWSWTPLTPLGDGPHTVSATQTDPAGNTGPATGTVSFTVDTASPDAPVVVNPADGSTTNDTTPTVTGSGEPGATVTVSIDGTLVGSAVADPAGHWSLPLTSALSEAAHTVAATQTDAAGNTSGLSTTNTFTVDTTAASAPLIQTPDDGSVTVDTTPTVTGTGEPGSTITLSLDGAEIGTATVDAGGSWSVPLTEPLEEGAHHLSATQRDAGGNTSPASPITVFSVDTTSPAAPVILAPADDSATHDTTPGVTGTGEPGARVTVLVDGDPVGTMVVAGDGTWTFEIPAALDEGPYDISATQTDSAGNVSAGAVFHTVTIDTTAPAAPVVSAPAAGEHTSDATPAVSGTGEAGASVSVVIDGAPAGSVTVAPDGTWSLTPSSPLIDGPHSVSATQTDPAGNTSVPSGTTSFTVDTATPAAPVVTGPADGTATNDTTPAISGTGEPGATVALTLDGVLAGTAVVGGTGSWSFTPAAALSTGTHTVSATQTDLAGNTGPASPGSTFLIDTSLPAAPVVSAPADSSSTSDTTPTITGTGEPGANITVRINGFVVGTAAVEEDGRWSYTPSLTLGEGSFEVNASQQDPAGNPSGVSNTNRFTIDTAAPAAPVITGPPQGTLTGDTTPTIAGTGEPGATLTVRIDDVAVGTALVEVDGTWTFTPTTPLTDGSHQVTATQTDAADNLSPVSNTRTFVVDGSAPDAPAITGPTPGSVTADNTPTITGTADPGATVTVLIDGVVAGTTTAAADGTWSFTPGTGLADGTRSVTATQTDAAGNTSSPSAALTFRVDTSAPSAPQVSGPAAGSTRDTTPTFSGSGEPGASVTITIDGVVRGTVIVGDDATWTYTPTTPLAEGPHQVSIVQTDQAGQQSPPQTVTVTVDTTAPATPTIGGPTTSSTTDSTPTITGTGEPGAAITVYVDGRVVGSTTVKADGTWALTLDDPLPAGSHTVRATQTDAAGNLSESSSVVTVIVSSAKPTTTPSPTTSSSATTSPGTSTASPSSGAATGSGPLARTGTEIALLAAIGIGLLGLGVALTTGRRRRSR